MNRQVLAALMRSIRLKRPEDALFYACYLRDNGYTRESLARYLFKCSLRDNLNIGLMEEAASALKNDKADLNRLVVNLARSQKLWSVEIGRTLVKIMCAVQEDHAYQKFSDAELLLKFSCAMDDFTRFAEAAQIAREVILRKQTFSENPWVPLIDDLQVRARSSPMSAAVELLRKATDIRIAEETLLFLTMAWLTTGLWGQDLDMIGGGLEFAVAGRKELWIPDWAMETDKRFSGDWDGYSNICLMVERDQSLNVDDDGVLFVGRGKEWRPVIKEEAGLYLVQSQSAPRKFYEVNLANLSCVCEDWVRRKHECKHIRWARIHAEQSLPFVIAS